MSESIGWSELAKQASEAGYGSTELPDGPHEVQVVSVKVGTTKGGHQQISLHLKVLSGAVANQHTWDNLVLNPGHAGSVAAFMNRARSYGGKEQVEAAFAAGASLSQIAQLILNATGIATVSHTRQKDDGGRWQDIKFKRTGTAQAGVPSVGVPAAPVQPGPAGVAPAPAVPAAPTIPPAPVTAPVPQTAEPVALPVPPVPAAPSPEPAPATPAPAPAPTTPF